MEQIHPAREREKLLTPTPILMRHRVWLILRQVLGWICIMLGIAGLVLPILQGVLFLVIGIALVGRRNIVLRWCAVQIKRFVRRWAALETPLIGWFGRVALRAQHATSCNRRRLVWWYAERYGTREAI